MDSLTGRHWFSRNVLSVAIGLLALSGGLASGLERSRQVVADVHYSGGEIYFQARVRASGWTLTVTGPGDFALQTHTQGSPPSVSLYDEEGQPLPDGSYTFELQAEFTRSTSSLEAQDGEGPDGRSVALREGVAPYSVPALSGHFRIASGSIVTPAQNEPAAPATAPRPVRGTTTAPDQGLVAAPDQVINDDQIVAGSICVGFDCVNGENFGFDTLRLKENNLRIKAQDTSNSGSFPSNDWQITFNDSSNGGQNKFSIDDIDGGRTPFTIEASAPSHSLYVDDGGRIGFGTSTPVVNLHVKEGNTPTLRLEQDGSSGFTPQTWDVAGNEANFFIRDVTNGSALPLRIYPDAPSNALTIEGTTGDIGIGTTSPTVDLHVKGSSTHAELILESQSASARWRWRANDVTGQMNVVDDLTSKTPLKIAGNSDTNLLQLGVNASDRVDINGQLFINGVDNSTPDYVFEPNYDLESIEEHARSMWENRHLPALAPARTTEDGKASFEIGARSQGMLEELEKAHIYIEQLNTRIETLSAMIGEKDAALAELRAEVEAIKEQVLQ